MFVAWTEGARSVLQTWASNCSMVGSDAYPHLYMQLTSVLASPAIATPAIRPVQRTGSPSAVGSGCSTAAAGSWRQHGGRTCKVPECIEVRAAAEVYVAGHPEAGELGRGTCSSRLGWLSAMLLRMVTPPGPKGAHRARRSRGGTGSGRPGCRGWWPRR